MSSFGRCHQPGRPTRGLAPSSGTVDPALPSKGSCRMTFRPQVKRINQTGPQCPHPSFSAQAQGGQEGIH